MRPSNKLYSAFLMRLAQFTENELAKVVQFQKEELAIVRQRVPGRLRLTAQERQRLVKYGKPLGKKLNEIITIVSPRTFARWASGETKSVGKEAQVGRKRTADEIRELILKIARETGAGYTKILGELKKLGINRVSRSTVVNILKEHGLDPGPKRVEGTWDEFVKRHAETLWATDFFSKKVWTKSGLVEFFVLFFINVATRRVHIAGMTPHPNSAWMAQQARNMNSFFDELPERPTLLIRDRDSKFTAEFDAILKSEGLDAKKVGPWAPNLNAYAERWVQSVRQECLEHFIVFGEAHLRHILGEYVAYYNEERPHQGVGNARLRRVGEEEPPTEVAEGAIVCRQRLGGLLKHYHRQAG